ncbi:MAG: bifunctional aldolase/short-chain dehydrogenase [Acidimicrobiales bacterium]
MKDAWNDDEADRFDGPLGELVYGSRLIGADPDLVLHGGGNTSIKAPWTDITGHHVEALYVKGSGWDLATIEAPGFTPLPLARLGELLALDTLSDADMMNELAVARLTAAAPQPSVETLLHAVLPHRAVLHSHADAIGAVTNLADGFERVRSVFGDGVVIVPYVMPGFDLAKAVSQLWPEVSHAGTVGMVLMNHGLFTFADTVRDAYRRHAELIARADERLDADAPVEDPSGARPLPDVDPVVLARLRRSISDAAGRPMVMTRHRDALTRQFVGRPDLDRVTQQGPLTPDHVIRTKRVPMLGRDVDGYVDAYRRYFRDHEARGRTALTMLDPAPRVVLDAELGLLTAGTTARDATIASDIYHHTMVGIARGEALGGYRGLPAADLFDVEYWELEQAKLRRGGAPPELAGRVAVVTGAASGIGRACAAELLARRAAVVGFDRDPEVEGTFAGRAGLGLTVDVTDADATWAAIGAGVERFGGIDLAVLAAGIFGRSEAVADLDLDEWRRVMAVNVDAAASLLARLHPLLAVAPSGGRVVVIASKNVAAPGRGAAAYSASKAALTQLARVAALEWAADGIRVNCVHPDAVFDTGLWTPDLLAERAASYGLTVDEYKRRNLLATEVTSASVARLVAEMCGDTFATTTGAQVPIDGGNERVI